MARKHIKELAAKLHFLTLDREAQRINECSGVTDLAKRAGMPSSTLKTLKSPANADQISIDHEEAIASACGFCLDWSEWRIGTCGEFQKRYLRDAKPQKTAERETRRIVGVRLAKGPRQEPIPSKIVGLASIEIDGYQFGAGGQPPLSGPV